MTETLSRDPAVAPAGMAVLDAWIVQVTAELAESLAEQARFAEADDLLDRIRRGGLLAPAVREWVNLVSGRMSAQRTGDHGGYLDQARALAERSGDDERMVRVACARAEAAWIAGRLHEARAEADRGWELAIERSDPWALGELSWWRSRAGSRAGSPVPIAAPFRSMLDGDWRAAAEVWLANDRVLWACYALGCSPSPVDARRAMTIADDVGAVAVRATIVRERRTLGLRVPLRPRSATRANPSLLTRRELETLVLLTEGLTNPQIARRLYLSERTVAHHVSAVLHKLGQPNRSAAAATAVRRGIVPLPEPGCEGDSGPLRAKCDHGGFHARNVPRAHIAAGDQTQMSRSARSTLPPSTLPISSSE